MRSGSMRLGISLDYLLRAKPMKKLVLAPVLAIVLVASQVLFLTAMSSPILAQTQLTPKAATARADNCAPIGRTAKGELVYSMKCENLPAPPAPPPQAEARDAALPPEPEGRRTGLVGWSYDRRKPDE